MGGHCPAVCRNWTGSGTWSLGNPDGVVVVVKNRVVHVADTQVPTRSHQAGPYVVEVYASA
jgi:hypothetical protein